MPLGWNVVLSFEAWSPMKPADFTGLDHYQEMFFDDEVFWQALWNTLIIIAIARRSASPSRSASRCSSMPTFAGATSIGR